MSTRATWRTLPALLFALFCACAPQRDSAAPSVFVYLIDTLRPDFLGCYGYGRESSPHIDAFAQEALVFTKATTPSPWTRPAVASLFTGLPPSLHGVKGRAGWLPEDFVSWPEALSGLGYECHAYLTNRNVDAYFGFAQGFAIYTPIFEADEYYASSERLHEEWLRGFRPPDGRPRFTYLHSMDPHKPYRPAEVYRERQNELTGEPRRRWRVRREHLEPRQDELRPYEAEILQNDASFGEFVGELKARGVYEQSWIILLSDHGEEFYEHGETGHGHALWETLLQVPLIIKPPGGKRGPAGVELSRRVDRPMGIERVPDLIGPYLDSDWTSLTRINAGKIELQDEFVADWLASIDAEAPTMRRASFNLDGNAGMMVEQGGLKLIWRDRPHAKMSCFDLKQDPQEIHDLWPREAPPRAERLAQELQDWSARTARGIELRYDGDAAEPAFCFLPDSGMLEASLPPAGRPVLFRIEDGEPPLVRWTPRSGDRILLRAAAGCVWILKLAAGSEFRFGPDHGHDALEAHGLSARALRAGSALDRRPDHPESIGEELPEDIRRHLRALGYVD